jgi:hypothetical protein
MMPANSQQDPSGNKATETAKATRLPFEPGQAKKKLVKSTAAQPTRSPATGRSPRQSSIPEVVSRRMVGRMMAFSGIPTVLGMMTFVVSYFIVKNHLFKLPNSAVLLVSLGFFGLGVLGLTYGVLSASWDEDRAGTWLGLEDFKLNFSRTVASWQEARQQARSPQDDG